MRVLFNKHFIFDKVIFYFHITPYLTELCVFCELLSMRTLCDVCHKEFTFL